MDPITLALIAFGLSRVFKAMDNRAPRSAAKPNFTYKKINGSWRAYFQEKPPSYSHVLGDDEGLYVCWSQPLRTESAARQVAKRWVETYG
jgi:hypothetical protein